MAATAKKKMSASLSMSLIESGELDNKTEKWIKANKDLEKLYKEKFEYSEIVELDPRKWSNNKLQAALKAFVKYDMKILAVRASQYMKEADKDESKLKKVIEKAEAEVKKSARQLKKKISLAVEELVADKGDNKRGLKDGKAALAKAKAIKSSKIFEEPATLAAKAMKKLASALKDAGDDGKATAKALSEAAKEIAVADKVFEDHAREAQAAVQMVRKVPKGIKNDAAPELKDFAVQIHNMDNLLGKFETAMDKFGKEMDEAVSITKSGKPDANLADRLARDLGSSKNETAIAKMVMKELRSLEADFKKVEHLLK